QAFIGHPRGGAGARGRSGRRRGARAGRRPAPWSGSDGGEGRASVHVFGSHRRRRAVMNSSVFLILFFTGAALVVGFVLRAVRRRRFDTDAFPSDSRKTIALGLLVAVLLLC